jgi:hypothetical protein
LKESNKGNVADGCAGVRSGATHPDVESLEIPENRASRRSLVPDSCEKRAFSL